MRHFTFTFVFTICLVWISLPSSVLAFTGKVVGVSDGDKIAVMHEGKAEKVRLTGIDCPEKGQAYGNAAKRFVSEQVFGKIVEIEVTGSDKYQRTLGEVILPDGESLNRLLVQAGLAWWFFKYSDDVTLGYLEVEAKAARRGLWKEETPTPPWTFRRMARKPNSRSLVEKRLPSTSSRQSPVVDGPILGNRRSKIYHRPDCRNYDDIAERNRVPFETAQEARDAGYRVAKNCP